MEWIIAHIWHLASLIATGFAVAFRLGQQTSKLEGRVDQLDKDFRTFAQEVKSMIADLKKDEQESLRELRADIKTIFINKEDK